MVRQANETLNGYAALEPLGWLRGYATFRAESLWLSVRHLEIVRLCLGGLAAKKNCTLDGKPEAFRTGGGTAANRFTTYR